MSTDLLSHTARQLRSLIGSKAISPVELFDASIARIEKLDPKLNAVVARDFARGRKAAAAAEDAVMNGEPLGPLHGLPVGVKDLTETGGLTTTFGSLVHKDHVPAKDDPIVAKIRAAGGIIIGKTNTPEFGAGANTVNRVYGATVNPFDPELSCAGSSGGSAVALATDMMPLATGSDLGGSLRTPASFCGVVGHRPSPGAVTHDTRRHGWSPHFVEGPMARNAEDAALLMAAMVGTSAKDPLSLDLSPDPFVNLATTDLSTLRVAFSADLGAVPVSKDVQEAFRKKTAKIAPLFASAEWIDPKIEGVNFTFETLRAVGFADTLTDYIGRHRDLAGPNVIANTELAKRVSVADVARAHAQQTEIVRNFQAFFADIDLLICPAASAVPFPVEQLFVSHINGEKLDTYITWCAIASAITLTTHPATVIPAGLGPSGMPFGLQIVGKYRDDAGTLSAAAALEAAFAEDAELQRPLPDLAGLQKRTSSAGKIPPALTAHVKTMELL
ncbi:amidase [Terrihabitans soli]|uniref:Amidase n=1 Tax=Terrihabitans soli TaxID=708113 RepID=A0A6S6QNX1_9HYPH|nr:amidase [Terrihabitans soli]BCJ90649.1 amidase [Terrihabitans soli]